MSEHDNEEEQHEDPGYLTYVQPLRVPPPSVQRTPPPPEPPSEPVPAIAPQPAPREPSPKLASPAPAAPASPPPASPVAPPRPAGADFENFEFRKPGQSGRPRRLLSRAAATVVVAVGLALAYPLVNPFGSSSQLSLLHYLQRFQPLAQRVVHDRQSVQSAVNAVRGDPSSRTAAARRLVNANRDRQALIQRLSALGPAPGAASALPGRLTRLLRIQVETGRVWQRWMLHRPFVYLKHDQATRTRIQALLASQQASKRSFTALYTQLVRDAGLPLARRAGI